MKLLQGLLVKQPDGNESMLPGDYADMMVVSEEELLSWQREVS